MGLYPNRGLEYRVYSDAYNYRIVIPLKDLDDRLAKSMYYDKRRANWVDNMQERVICKVEESELPDVVLSEYELELVDKHKINAKEHGFYDVMYVGSTL